MGCSSFLSRLFSLFFLVNNSPLCTDSCILLAQPVENCDRFCPGDPITGMEVSFCVTSLQNPCLIQQPDLLGIGLIVIHIRGQAFLLHPLTFPQIQTAIPGDDQVIIAIGHLRTPCQGLSLALRSHRQRNRDPLQGPQNTLHQRFLFDPRGGFQVPPAASAPFAAASAPSRR